MADSKITALTALTAADPANDMIPIVDVSDTPPASGNTKRISINNLLACSPSATLASATITGDLTVDTSTLKVDSANDAVGIGTTSPTTYGAKLAVIGSGNGVLAVGQATSYTTLQSNGQDFYLNMKGTGSTIFRLGSGDATAMTLNATGLGVGGSVSSKLTLTVTPATAGSDGLIINGPSSRQIIAGITGATYSYAGVGANQNLIYGGNAQLNILGDNQNVRIGTSSTSYLLLDTAGNCGIGVAPRAWAGDYKAAQVAGITSLYGSASVSGVGSNIYWDGSIRYIAAQAGSFLQFSGKSAAFYQTTDASPVAGGVAAFTAAMTLDANGNLILQSSATPSTLTVNGQLTVNATSNTNLRFSYRGSDGVTRVANITLA